MQKLVPIVRNAGEGDKQLFAGGGLHIWKLLAEDTGGAFFLFEDTMVKDKTTPLHLHPEAHEMTYVIDGEIEVQADGQRGAARPEPSFGTPHSGRSALQVVRLTTARDVQLVRRDGYRAAVGAKGGGPRMVIPRGFSAAEA